MRGRQAIQDAVDDALGIHDGEITADRRYGIETVACLGTCFLAPVVMIDHDYFGSVTPERGPRDAGGRTSDQARDPRRSWLRSGTSLASAAEGKKRVLVCSTGCLAVGARDVEAAFREGVAAAGLEDEVEVVATGATACAPWHRSPSSSLTTSSTAATGVKTCPT